MDEGYVVALNEAKSCTDSDCDLHTFRPGTKNWPNLVRKTSYKSSKGRRDDAFSPPEATEGS